MEITLLSGRKIGDGHPTFIVCEIGSNWTSLQDCLDSIHKAKTCGADAVKFQAYDHGALYGFHQYVDILTKDYQIERGPVRPMKGQLPLEWLPALKEKADQVGIEFMCTAFSPELVDAVDPYVNIHKVASAELTHVRILEKLRSKGKPVFLSTGASGVEDIRRAIHTLSYEDGRRSLVSTVVMYCVAAYPAREVDLGCIGLLRDQFRVLAGYSDHSTDVLVIPRSAAQAGACVIEKHVTFIEAETPDSPHSLNCAAFQRLVLSIRGHRSSAGPGPTIEEMPMLLRHNRRLIATQDLPEGGILTEGVNFGIYRSLKDDTHAFSPWLIGEVAGKRAKRGIRAGDGVGPGDV